MKTYSEHYLECRKKYQETYNLNELPNIDFLYNFTAFTAHPSKDNDILQFEDDYTEIINTMATDLGNRFTIKSECWFPPGLDVNKDFAIRIKDIWSIKGAEEFCQRIIPQLEEKLFGSHVFVEGLYAYRNVYKSSDARSSWVWHYDNHPKETIKVMVYLTDVVEESGAFEVMQKEDGSLLKFETTRVDHKKWSNINTRIEGSQLDNIRNLGFEPKKVLGDKGTICVFDNNIIHRASIPQEGFYRDAIVFMIRPCGDRISPFISNEHTGTNYHVDLTVDPEHLGVQKR